MTTWAILSVIWLLGYRIETDAATGKEKRVKIPVDWFDGYEEE